MRCTGTSSRTTATVTNSNSTIANANRIATNASANSTVTNSSTSSTVTNTISNVTNTSSTITHTSSTITNANSAFTCYNSTVSSTSNTCYVGHPGGKIYTSYTYMYYITPVMNVENGHCEVDTLSPPQVELRRSPRKKGNESYKQSSDETGISNAHLYTGSSTEASTCGSKRAGIYTKHQAASDMQGYLAEVLREMALVRIKSSPYIRLMVDESLDIATTKKLVMFCKIIHNGSIKVEFCANVDISDGKALTVYTAINVDTFSGFGSDGAAVMTGKRSGVGVKLKAENPRILHIWCTAHRLALVSYWAAKSIPYLQYVQETLVNIYNFFEYSAPRYNKLRELNNILGGKVKKIKKPSNVRWLSLQDAIEAVHTSWSALVIRLEHEVPANPQSEGGNKAKGILKKVKSFKFIATVCLLKDILEWICRLSKYFQKDIIDIDQVDSHIKATKDTILVFEFYANETPSVQTLINFIDEADMYRSIGLTCSLSDRMELQSIRMSFIHSILKEFEERFSPEDMSILKDLNILLNPKLLPENHESIIEHGSQALDRVLDFYGDILNTQEVKNSFLQFKFLLNVNIHLSAAADVPSTPY